MKDTRFLSLLLGIIIALCEGNILDPGHHDEQETIYDDCSIVSVSGSRQHKNRHGDYEHLPSMDCGSRPSYRQINGNTYIFYLSDLNYWMIGDAPCKDNGALSVYSESAMSPFIVGSNWDEFDAAEWQVNKNIRVRCLGCSMVTVSGASHQASRNGDYVRMDGVWCGTHLAYNQINGDNFLFYEDTFNGWMIGRKNCENFGGIYAIDTSDSPNRISSEWQEFGGDDWGHNAGITAGCRGPMDNWQLTIIPPGAAVGDWKFPWGNEAYKFLNESLHFLESHDKLIDGIHERFNKELNEPVCITCRLTTEQWTDIFGGNDTQVTSYDQALDHLAQQFLSLPPGTTIPLDVLDPLFDVLQLRNEWNKRSNSREDDLTGAWESWVGVGDAVVKMLYAVPITPEVEPFVMEFTHMTKGMVRAASTE